MQYQSTRGKTPMVNSAQAVILGMAGDGGLYLPQELPAFHWQECVAAKPMEMAEMLLSAFLPEIPNMAQLVDKAYRGKFETEDLTPTVKVGDMTVLELFRGPTSAFKDVALSMLPQLMTAARQAEGKTEDVLILTATSGDTGKAALVGFQDVPGIKICVFYPDGGVSQIQRRQMASQLGENVTVCAIRGNFDDAQTGVKEIFARAREEKLPLALSSANSINIGRLVPQTMYYFKAYRDLLDRGEISLGDKVNFSVPTGNFGDILAGYLASKLGLPVGMLVCASNANDVLTEFLRTGVYSRLRPFHKTISPSMDILVSSNLERLLYLESGDARLVDSLMQQLKDTGRYQVPEELFERIKGQFWGYSSDDAAGKKTVNRVWQAHGYLCDPHTAAAWVAAESYREETGDHRPMVVLSTASAYKFPAAVLEALGQQPERDEFLQMDQLCRLTNVKIPKNLATLKEMPLRHKDVIGKDEMLDYVRNIR